MFLLPGNIDEGKRGQCINEKGCALFEGAATDSTQFFLHYSAQTANQEQVAQKLAAGRTSHKMALEEQPFRQNKQVVQPFGKRQFRL